MRANELNEIKSFNIEDVLDKFYKRPSIEDFKEALEISYDYFLRMVTRKKLIELREYYGLEMKRPENRRIALNIAYKENICATVLNLFEDEDEYIWIDFREKEDEEDG